MNNNPLKKSNFLNQLSNEELDDILKSGKIGYFKRNDVILKENTFLKTLPIILSGVVRVFVVNQEDVGKREVLLYYMKEGETCSSSIASGIFNDKIDIRVEAETDCEILFLPLYYFTQLLSKHPELFELLLQNYLQIFKKIVNTVSALSFYPLEKQLYALLIAKAKLRESNIVETTHEELARELRSTREVITRILNQLADEKKIKIYRGKIEILNLL
ncbi:MAG: Crp/Fnr family transcriptional regulator [Bacteroidia bacterium]|nr:MAG: Crp/Fnr family transcriptional regulator [Bacteroidia bacterium]